MTFISHSQTRPVVVPLFSLRNVDTWNETRATLTKTILAAIFIFAMVLSYPRNSTASQPHVNRKYTSEQPVSKKPLTCPELPANDRWAIARHDGQTNFLFPLDTPITPTMLPPISRTNLIHVYPAVSQSFCIQLNSKMAVHVPNTNFTKVPIPLERENSFLEEKLHNT